MGTKMPKLLLGATLLIGLSANQFAYASSEQNSATEAIQNAIEKNQALLESYSPTITYSTNLPSSTDDFSQSNKVSNKASATGLRFTDIAKGNTTIKTEGGRYVYTTASTYGEKLTVVTSATASLWKDIFKEEEGELIDQGDEDMAVGYGTAKSIAGKHNADPGTYRGISLHTAAYEMSLYERRTSDVLMVR
ncbi:hypothetical protein [Brevibacillus brevis]|uniref:hypothetical protein n=2 Tax=Brevibacillus brevis TaxID=1393 RepID=UPI000D0FBE1E|nr:hypothetical protein [Brevibacillus brevis]PSJ67310.1 hypothetical protein C7J99_21255 [Brevibacillus brevis]GEC91903.1 hypothetical protein BBR01nite_42340 [Brevibacillus brevis]